MTDTTGRSFLSYRRSRAPDARRLIEAQHELGIPTWQDTTELEHGHTDELLREVLVDEATANALCWLTPDVEHSAVITRTELPLILDRAARKDGFFATPVAAGGLAYTDVTRVVGTHVGLHDVGDWNVHKVSSDPLVDEEARAVARLVLKRRIHQVSKQAPSGAPLRLVLNTRKAPAFEAGVALSLDWTHRFDGRLVTSGDDWKICLLPALEFVAQALEQHAPGRPIIAEGLCALPAAVALGTTFLATRRLPVSWRQVSPRRPPQLWAVDATQEASGFVASVQSANSSATDLALLVSIASNVDQAFCASRSGLPPFRAIVSVTKPGTFPHDLESAGQAADLVRVIIEGLRKARDDHQPRGVVHLFLAVPAGVALMIGQMLNTFGPVQTYEHMPLDAVGKYHPAALLEPSM